MNTNEIIPREVQGQHCVKLIPFLRESIGQTGESTHLHSHGQVLSLNVRGTNFAYIGIPEHWDLLASDTLSGRVPRFGFGSRSILFDQLRELNALRSQAQHNGILVRCEAVRGHLKTSLCCRSQLFRESYCIPLGSSSQVPSEYQLTAPLDSDKRIGIADRGFVFPFFGFGLFLHSDVSPKLITLHVFDSQVVDALIHQSLAFLASETQEIENRSRMYASDARSGANRATFDQVLQNAHGFLFGQDHVAERSWLYFYERLPTFWAAISLLTLPVLPELLSWQVADSAVHFVSSREQHKSIKSRKQCQAKSFVFREKNRVPFPRPPWIPKPIPKRLPARKTVTIAIGFTCNEGVVIAADSQETIEGYMKDLSKAKVRIVTFPPTSERKGILTCAYAGSGWSDYIETAIERADDSVRHCKSIPEAEDALRKSLKKFHHECIQPWATFQENQQPSVELLIGVSVSTAFGLYHYTGTSFHRCDGHKSIGTGQILSNSLSTTHYTYEETIETLIPLAVYVLYKVKKHGEGCGGFTQVVALKEGGDFAIVEGIEKFESAIEKMEGASVKRWKETMLASKKLPKISWFMDAVSKNG